MTGRLLSYFPDEEILAQRGGVISPSWNSQMMKEQRRAPQFADAFWRPISNPSTPYPCFFSSTSFPHLSYSFPWDAVTNDYKLSGLRQHTLICLRFWRPKVGSQYLWLKSRCWQDHAPFRGSRGVINFLALPSICSCIPCIPWFVASSFIFTANSTASPFSDSAVLFFWHTPSSLPW